MDPINHFGFSYNNIHHHHLPIRRFSQAARVEEHHQFMSNDDHVYLPEITNCLDPTEEFRFVDTFFNINHCSLSKDFDFDLDVDFDPDTFLMPNDNTDVDMMTETDGQDQTRVNGVDDGLRLVHLLLACAEAVGCRDTRLADSILSQIWYLTNPLGDSLQRVSYCFAIGLKTRITLLHTNVNPNGTVFTGTTGQTKVKREDRIEAFHLLHQNTQYLQFAFTAANEAILNAVHEKKHDRLHITDLGIEHVLQWRALIQTLASSSTAAGSVFRPKFITITGILGEWGDMAEVETGMESLAAEADSTGIELGFRLLAGPATPETLTKENLGIKEDELVFVNSILHLHTYVKESRGSLKSILQSVKNLQPSLLTVVEQDANHNGPFFLGRFLESLHYYSAIFDSLEACLGRNSVERMKIEKNYFGEEIKNIVAREGIERVERHETADQWRRQLGRAGFQVVAGRKVREVIPADGYTVENDKKGNVLLGWKGRPIMLAAAWRPSLPPSSAA